MMEALRNEYRACQKLSGLDSKQFRFQCRWLGMLLKRGTPNESVFTMTPEMWVKTAHEVVEIHNPAQQELF